MAKIHQHLFRFSGMQPTLREIAKEEKGGPEGGRHRVIKFGAKLKPNSKPFASDDLFDFSIVVIVQLCCALIARLSSVAIIVTQLDQSFLEHSV